jgi:pyridoxal phosphate enzyme (YggS family)
LSINTENYRKIKNELDAANATLVAVSKIQSEQNILELYNEGQRDFGENYVQELVDKYEKLPKDIRWHFIGHLQSNKVKYIAPFIHLIHGVDRLSLLKEINKQAIKNNRKIDCLLQIHIADEDTKFGFDEKDLQEFLNPDNPTSDLSKFKNIRLRGLMGMATFTDDTEKIRHEFKGLKKIFDMYFPEKNNAENDSHEGLNERWILSMGMSADYKIALGEGSNMVRIGSLLFGARL